MSGVAVESKTAFRLQLANRQTVKRDIVYMI